MKGRVLSRRSRYARLLPMTAMVSGLLVVLPSCASKAGQEQGTPAPAETPKAPPRETASAQPKPAQPAPAAPTPAPAPAPAVAPAPPAAVDTAAIVAQFCSRIMSGVKAQIRQDSTPADPYAATQKIVATIPEATAKVALAKGTTCR